MAIAPQPPAALPPAFIMDFVKSVFTNDLCLVDFTQALTAMDYLKHMESKRKLEMHSVLERLNVDVNTLDQEKERLRIEYPVVADWVASIVDKAKRVESLYTQVYIGLRRWTLINEMRLEPYNKTNCIAMLNALYPANQTTLPSSGLTPMHLNSQRNAFFRYILSVETNGKNVLQKLEQQGKRPADANAWPIVRDIVDKYLRHSNQLINDCMEIHSPADVEVKSQPMDKRTDSGVSFASSKSDNSNASVTQVSYLQISAPRSRSGSTVSHHRKTSSTGETAIVRPEQLRLKEVRKVGSTLERLAREIKRMRSRSNDRSLDSDRPSSRTRGSSNTSNESDDLPPFSVASGLMPSTATTLRFPETYLDSDHHTPLPTPSSSRPKSLKKIKSAGNLHNRDSAFSVHSKYGVAPQTPRLAGSNASALNLHGTTASDRKHSAPTINRHHQPFSITEEERSRMIARAKAEKENASREHERYSPIRSRSDAAFSNESDQGDTFLEPIDVPVRRTSPGRNKLRDYFGVDTLQVPTNFAN